MPKDGGVVAYLVSKLSRSCSNNKSSENTRHSFTNPFPVQEDNRIFEVYIYQVIRKRAGTSCQMEIHFSIQTTKFLGNII